MDEQITPKEKILVKTVVLTKRPDLFKLFENINYSKWWIKHMDNLIARGEFKIEPDTEHETS